MIALMAALTHDFIIGKNGQLPWSIPDELKHFRDTTRHHVVIMGRKTYESVNRPMPNRHNIVVSSKMDAPEGVQVVPSLNAAIELAKTYKTDIYIIGGTRLFEEGLKIADKMFLSWIKEDYPGDTFFPKFDESEWEIESTEDLPEWTLKIYSRRST